MRSTTNDTQIQEPTTIETAQLDGVTGGCAACGNAACQPGQQQQPLQQALQQPSLQQALQQPIGAPRPL